MTVDVEISSISQGRTIAKPGDSNPVDHKRAAATAAGGSRKSFAKVAEGVAGRASAKAPQEEPNQKRISLWEKGDFSFGDFLDIINPMHHVPIVATLYRNLTGDQIGMAPRVIGGALWGRIGGFVSGVVNAVVEWLTGKDIGDHIYAAIWGTTKGPENKGGVAQASIGRSDEDKDAAVTVEEIRPAPELSVLTPPQAPAQRLRQPSGPRSSEPGMAPALSITTDSNNLLLGPLVSFNYRRNQRQVEALRKQQAMRWIA
jgi:hypothetical protein